MEAKSVLDPVGDFKKAGMESRDTRTAEDENSNT
jgi:hypothetical protein